MTLENVFVEFCRVQFNNIRILRNKWALSLASIKLAHGVKMSLIPGKYQHYKNENVDDYFMAVGVPYMGRKIIAMTSPLMEIKLEGNVMSIKNYSLLMTIQSSFNLNEEYDEKMPASILKSKTTMINEREFETVSTSPNGVKHRRLYSITEDECVMTLSHEKSNIKGKRYFRRVS